MSSVEAIANTSQHEMTRSPDGQVFGKEDRFQPDSHDTDIQVDLGLQQVVARRIGVINHMHVDFVVLVEGRRHFGVPDDGLDRVF